MKKNENVILFRKRSEVWLAWNIWFWRNNKEWSPAPPPYVVARPALPPKLYCFFLFVCSCAALDNLGRSEKYKSWNCQQTKEDSGPGHSTDFTTQCTTIYHHRTPWNTNQYHAISWIPCNIMNICPKKQKLSKLGYSETVCPVQPENDKTVYQNFQTV